MKGWTKLCKLFISLPLLCSFSIPIVKASEEKAGIQLSKENFPDDRFLAYIKDKFDKNADGILNLEEMQAITYINVDNKGITSLKGIEHFSELTSLHADVNRIKELDISKNKKLVSLFVNNNELDTINFGEEENHTLEYVDIFANHITRIDLSKLKAMTFLHIDDNRLKELDLSQNKLTQQHGFVAQNNFLNQITLPNNNKEYQFKEFLATQLFPKDKSVGYKVEWYLDKDKKQILDPEKTPNIVCKGQTLYASYVPITYTITYSSAQGIGSMPNQTMTYNQEEALSQNKFQKEGYIFAGWKDQKNKIYKDQQMVRNLTSKDKDVIHLYATWSEKGYIGEKYSIVLHDQGKQTRIDATYGKATQLPKVEEKKEGYTFQGWALSENASITYKDNETLIINSPHQMNRKDELHLYAIWEKNVYDVVFHNEKDIQTKKVAYKDPIVFPKQVNKIGYEFEGWQTKEGNIITANTPVVSHMDLYAKYKANQYSITLHKNGADEEENVDTMILNATYDEDVILPKNPYHKKYHTFEGWALQPNQEVKYRDQGIVRNLTADNKANITLYAKWKPNHVKVTLKDQEKTIEKEIEAGTTVALPVLSKEGYLFQGWYKQEDHTLFQPETVIENDLILYAKYKPIQYTINFHKNDEKAINQMESITATYDKKMELPENKFQKEHAHFLGWSTSKNGEVIYHDKASVMNLTNQNQGIIDLYAKWANNVVNITIYDGINAGYTIQVEEGKSLPSSILKERKGYTFDGWYTSSDFASDNAWKIENAIEKEMSLYAKWTLDQYTITFDGVNKDPIQLTVNDRIVIEDPSKDNFDFLYWEDQEGNRYFNVLENISRNLVLRPVWKKVVDNNVVVNEADEKEFIFGMSQEEKQHLSQIFVQTFQHIDKLSDNKTSVIQKIRQLQNQGKVLSGSISFTKKYENEIAGKELQMIQHKIAELSKQDNKNYYVGQYVDVQAHVRNRSTYIGTLQQILQPVEIRVAIPKQLQNKNRQFKVLRVHNNQVDILDCVQDRHILKFKSDRFSTYAIVYSDLDTLQDSSVTQTQNNSMISSSNTGQPTVMIGYVLLLMVSFAVLYVLYYYKKQLKYTKKK